MKSERPANAHTMSETPSVPDIPVIGDIPTDEPGLRFEEYAKAIAGAVKSGNPPQFTIGLYGPWGSGKTSLLKAIERILGQESDVIAVFFDAWRYEKSEHIIVPLLYSIYSSVEKHQDKKVSDLLKRALQSTVYGLSFQIGIAGQGLKLSGQDFADKWESEDLLPALDEAFDRPFNELRELPNVLREGRIVVLIDDLDRCSPEKVVSVLESINLVMDVPGFIFVLALDYDVLVRAINEKYKHVSGDEFVQKIIQLPFRVPSLPLESTESLAELIPSWGTWAKTLPAGLPDHLRNISERGLDSNPRQIKRLINSF
jgi:predicted KAP-like P-loop ATPase